MGLGVIRTLKWAKMPQWHAVVEMVLGIVVIINNRFCEFINMKGGIL